LGSNSTADSKFVETTRAKGSHSIAGVDRDFTSAVLPAGVRGNGRQSLVGRTANRFGAVSVHPRMLAHFLRLGDLGKLSGDGDRLIAFARFCEGEP
jgi:hypothetical protein